jgi:cytochrome c oxidase subunit IV
MVTATHSHPTTKTYWMVGGFLAAVTAVEIGISYIDALGPARGVLLVILGIVKFVTVVAVFMHLRYDLRGYRVLFLFGLIGALIVFAVVLAAMQAF